MQKIYEDKVASLYSSSFEENPVNSNDQISPKYQDQYLSNLDNKNEEIDTDMIIDFGKLVDSNYIDFVNIGEDERFFQNDDDQDLRKVKRSENVSNTEVCNKQSEECLNIRIIGNFILKQSCLSF